MTDTPASPGGAAMEAARQWVLEAEPRRFREGGGQKTPELATIIQRAIDAAVAPVAEEREVERQCANKYARACEKAVSALLEAQQQRDAARAAVGELRTALEAVERDIEGPASQNGYPRTRAACQLIQETVRAALAATQPEQEKP